jgi:hypothetical protein
MPLTSYGRNAVWSGPTAFSHFGAFTDLGQTEVAGGSYARAAITWNSVSSGRLTQSGQLLLAIPAGTTVVTVGDFSAASAGNALSYAGYDSTAPAKGIATVTASTDVFRGYADGLNPHGLNADDRIFFWPIGQGSGGVLPTGLSATTLYWVLAAGLTTTEFKVSTSSGGGAVDVSDDGAVAWQVTVPNTFTSAGTISVASGNHALDGNFA